MNAAAHVLDVDASGYHADACETPSLSVSIAKVLLDRSAEHAYAMHPRLGNTVKREPTSAMDHGSLVHKLMLGKGAEIEIVEAKDWRTKAAQTARAVARELGQIPVLEKDYEAAVVASIAITKRLYDIGIAFTGESELPIAWTEDTYRGRIWCRGMLDHVVGPTIFDIKTTESVTRQRCARLAVDLGYTMQAAAYSRGLERLRPEHEGRSDFVLIFVETAEPYAVLPAKLDGVLRRHGERRWEAAVLRWAECLGTGKWPPVADRIERLEAPPWLIANMEE